MYRMLIADDNKYERDGMKYLISKYKLPLEISEARNGKEALQIIEQQEFDLLLTDIKMPFMDGLQLVKAAREICPNLKIILLSGHSEFEYARAAIPLKVLHYLLKPVEAEALRSVLSEVVEQCEQEESQNHNVNLKPYTGASAPSKSEADGSRSADSEYGKRAVDELIRIIETKYNQDLSLEYLAASVHLSGSYLSHIFKKRTGTSVVKYINQYRMEKAKEFLDQSNYKINDVYKMVGYSDFSYFGVSFKQHFGLTPTQYREKVRSL
ncbi:response regulator transcription factor [Paenibacillus sp. FSL P4-0184]|uniref:response regulator transcription factor n=1 Tax=Paenibacillus sp. FSL P4-0184 TaxID=2921632 RepID=UPI0030F9B4C5